MVELLVWIEGPDSLDIVKVMEAKNSLPREEWEALRVSYKAGDIFKVLPKGWHRYHVSQIGPKIVLRVKKLGYLDAGVRQLVWPLEDPQGNLLQKRRFCIDLKKMKAGRVVTVRDLRGLLKDKTSD